MNDSRPTSVARIVAATGNPNKLLELQTVGVRFGVTVLSPEAVCKQYGLELPPEVIESGATYFENAVLKAESYVAWSGLPSVGDDSGLEVEALDGRPGLYSARYLGPDATYEQRMKGLVDELRNLEETTGVSNRRAFYRCSLVLSYPGGAQFTAQSSLEGHILDSPQGDKGFGYDRIVCIETLGCTLAEVEFDVTCTEGFRAKAANELFEEVAYY